MATVLLIFIYFTFISLGLPDSMLGSSFPAISDNLDINPSINSALSIIVTCGTIISSLLSSWLIKKLKTPYIVLGSILLTVLGLILFSLTKSDYTWLFYVACIPLGLGAGAIDSALNNYVALHYKAIHMNWLHCSWGVGASIGPMIVSAFIDPKQDSAGWNWGVTTIAGIQFLIFLLVFISLPLWNKVAVQKQQEEKTDENDEDFKISSLFHSSIIYLTIIGFFCYCAVETTTGLWVSSYFSFFHGLDSDTCALLGSIFYLGITVGRFICGPLSLKLDEKTMIRIGEGIMTAGMILALFGTFTEYVAMAGFIIVGLGCAPVYPAVIRSTPYRFSRAGSPKVMGLEMAGAYLGNLIVSPLFGLVAEALGNKFEILPWVTLVLAVAMIVCHETINLKLSRRDRSLSPEELKKYKTI